MNDKLDLMVDAPALRELGFVPEPSPAVSALAAPLPGKAAPFPGAGREPTAAECHLLAAALHPQGIDGTCWLDKPLTSADCYSILRRATTTCSSTLDRG